MMFYLKSQANNVPVNGSNWLYPAIVQVPGEALAQVIVTFIIWKILRGLGWHTWVHLIKS